LKNDLSVWDDRRGSYNLLFSPPKHIISLKKEFPLCPPPSWKKEKKNVLVKTIVKYIYPHYTRYSLSTQRQARQTQIQRHTPFTVGFDVDKFKASSPAQYKSLWAYRLELHLFDSLFLCGGKMVRKCREGYYCQKRKETAFNANKPQPAVSLHVPRVSARFAYYFTRHVWV
jgi:hypothetical protein